MSNRFLNKTFCAKIVVFISIQLLLSLAIKHSSPFESHSMTQAGIHHFNKLQRWWRRNWTRIAIIISLNILDRSAKIGVITRTMCELFATDALRSIFFSLLFAIHSIIMLHVQTYASMCVYIHRWSSSSSPADEGQASTVETFLLSLLVLRVLSVNNISWARVETMNTKKERERERWRNKKKVSQTK